MKAKRPIKIHIDTDEIVSAVEENLIQIWRDGMLEAPTSPLEAASVLSVQALRFIK
jgi:hypothetical protein